MSLKKFEVIQQP